MPDPKNYKNKKDFLDACIPMVIEEGTAKDSDQAVAICNSMWENKKEFKPVDARIKTGKLTRTFELDIRELDKEKRSIPLSFSSEEPVERFFGVEILDHDPKSVRMDRLKKGVPILLNHDRDKQIGILENPRIDSDRIGRGMARFGKGQLSTEVWQDIQDGIRRDVSVGYRIHQMVLEKQEDDENTYRATDWEPMEVSIVSIPADISVGIGRGEGNEYEINVKQKEKSKMPDEIKVVPPVDTKAIEDAAEKRARDKENLRVSEIMAMGQRGGKLDDAMKYVKEGKTVDEFRAFILDAALSNLKPTVNVGNDRAESEPFKTLSEFLYAVRFDSGDPRLRPRWNPEVGKRAQSMGVGAAGGFAVPEQFRPNLLQVNIQDAMIRSRATVIPAGDPPDAAIELFALDQGTTKGMYAGFSVEWIGEAVEKPDTEFFLRQLKLEPKEVAATCRVTDKLIRNWPACTSVVEQLARKAIIAAEENAFISGNGIGKPIGLLDPANTAAITVNRNGANTVVWADVSTMYRKMISGSRPAWIASSSIKTQMITMKDDGSNLVWLPSARDGEPEQFLGWPIYYYDRLPGLGTKGDLMLVDLSYYLIKDGSGPYFAASDQVYFTRNMTVFKIFWNVDGQPWVKEAFPLEGSSTNTVSPFVILN